MNSIQSALLVLFLPTSLASASQHDPEPVRIGLNHPRTGIAVAEGLDQWRAAQLAVDEINAEGGVLGRPLELVARDSRAQVLTTQENVSELIDEEGCKMILGGTSSAVAVAAGEVCRARSVPFFAALAYADSVTGAEGNRYSFRECYDTWASSKALAAYLNEHFAGKQFFYLTADQTWGHTTESTLRKFTATGDVSKHRGMLMDFPSASEDEFKRAISFAKLVNPDVLVLVLFGKDMEAALRQAAAQGLRSKVQVVVPNLTLGMAESAGPEVMQGVLGAVPWCWQVPATFGHWRGRRFVESFLAAYDRYPSSAAASAYAIVRQWKEAVERAGSFAGPDVVRALEGHHYVALKDGQTWRAWDHQSVQSVYVVRCKPADEVRASRLGLDFFEVVSRLQGDLAFRTKSEWEAARAALGKPPRLGELGDAVANK